MLGTLIFIILIASVIALSGGFLLLALRLGKNFEQMGGHTPPAGQPQRRSRPRR